MSIFSKIKVPKVKRSTFNLSEEMKLSCNFGEIVPILCKEVLPNDTFKIDTELLIKFAPLKAPVMHRIKAKVDYFFVPNYQICDAFEDFINPKVNTAANPITLPCVSISTLSALSFAGISSLADYLGLPVDRISSFSAQTMPDLKISLLPFMAYQHIYNSYYRDQNLQPYVLSGAGIYENTSFKSKTGEFDPILDQSLLASLLTLRWSAWKKDYFSSALPSPQAGDDVKIPIFSSENPIDASSVDIHFGVVDDDEDGRPQGGPYGVILNKTSSDKGLFYAQDNISGYSPLSGFLKSNIQGINLNQNHVSVNDLRKLFSLQRFKELAERGGTRYTEVVRNFFGAFLPDIYFDRPLYLGGQVQPINIGEVVSTTSNPDDESGVNLGFRGGIASSYGMTRSVSYHAKSHGFIMGLLRILPEATYSQGVERMWTRENIFDYAFPQFAHLGEQEIRNQELFLDSDVNNSGVFGYTPRYAEYKHGNCHIAGDFRSNLSYWHFGRKFGSLPTLSASFIANGMNNYDPFYVTDSSVQHVYVNLYNKILAKRPLPYFGTPGGI